MTGRAEDIIVRSTRPEDFPDIIELTKKVYPTAPPWNVIQLSSHLALFPEGQFVAVESKSGRVMGMAASLIVLWDDYDMHASWKEFTDTGMFTNHDPARGRTLYSAEVMVRPSRQRHGIGTKLYEARRELVERLMLLRIRAGARLRGYHRFVGQLSPEDYVIKVVNKEHADATLSFQLKLGFHVLAVVENYLKEDPESLGYAAVIEWLNPQVAKPEDYAGRNPKFMPRVKQR